MVKPMIIVVLLIYLSRDFLKLDINGKTDDNMQLRV